MGRRGFRSSGRVVGIDAAGIASVSLMCATACGSCHAKGACPSASGEERIVRVDGEGLTVGDLVEVGVSYHVGAYATMMAYLLPLLIFVGTISVAILLGCDQAISALVGFGLTGLYYIGLYLFRRRMEGVVRLEVRKV